jgi:hypothetical protein
MNPATFSQPIHVNEPCGMERIPKHRERPAFRARSGGRKDFIWFLTAMSRTCRHDLRPEKEAGGVRR